MDSKKQLERIKELTKQIAALPLKKTISGNVYYTITNGRRMVSSRAAIYAIIK